MSSAPHLYIIGAVGNGRRNLQIRVGTFVIGVECQRMRLLIHRAYHVVTFIHQLHGNIIAVRATQIAAQDEIQADSRESVVGRSAAVGLAGVG